jgi:hypothetical protein
MDASIKKYFSNEQRIEILKESLKEDIKAYEGVIRRMEAKYPISGIESIKNAEKMILIFKKRLQSIK